MKDTLPPKPVPRANATSQPFWDAAADGKLLYQRCVTCERAQYYPRALCTHCGSRQLAWGISSRQGEVHAVTRVHVGLPAFKGEAPYDVVLVDMDEGFRMLVNVRGNGDEVAIGSRGEIVFEAQGDFHLPQFKPRDE